MEIQLASEGAVDKKLAVLDAALVKSLENCLGDREQRYRMIALGVLYNRYRFQNHNYKSSFSNFGNFECAQNKKKSHI